MKEKSQKRKSSAGLSEHSNPKVRKISQYDSSNLMNKLEEFSDIWNDCPIVQNPRQSYDSRLGEYERPIEVMKSNKEENYKLHKQIYNRSDEKDKSSFEIVKEKKKSKEHVRHRNSEVFENDKHSSKKNGETPTTNNSKKEDNNTQSGGKYDPTLADMKRKKAVHEQRQLHVDQKNIIQQALSSLDVKHKANKKIVFSDAEEVMDDQEEDYIKPKKSKSTERKKLFNDADSESETELKLNPQFEGKKGQKLLELQSKFASDSRFALDTRFYESGSEGSDNEGPKNTPENDEKQKQLAILESIVQREIKPLSEIKKKSKRSEEMLLLRFDPTREEHSKYIVKQTEPPTGEEIKKKKKKRKKEEVDIAARQEENKTKVSAEKFSTITEDLKEVLTKETGPTEFSLLKLFGPKETIADQNSKPEKSEIMKKVKYSTRNPFKYDSSESETEEEGEQKMEETKMMTKIHEKRSTVSWKTYFFFTENDPRFQEALEFIKGPEDIEDDKQYAEKRKILKNFIRHKYKNNIRKKTPFKKKLGGFKRKIFKKKKGKR